MNAPNMLEVYFRDRKELLDTLEKRFEKIDGTLKDHQEFIDKIEKHYETMDQMAEMFIAAKGGFTMLTWMYRACKYLLLPVTFYSAYVIYKNTGKWEFKFP